MACSKSLRTVSKGKQAMTELDYPLTRQDVRCPNCGGEKSIGPVWCWQCYGAHNLRYGAADGIRKLLQANEAALECREIVLRERQGR
jgi:hypothetical protein